MSTYHPSGEGETVIGSWERVVLSNCGLINPESIEEYIAQGGYMALGKALTEMKSEEIIAEVKASGLVGRGGAGFPTGLKWEFTAKASGQPKYIIGNLDESEPGTFKDRIIVEGDPHRILEAMAVAGYAVGAREGYIYVRGEYLVAQERLEKAIAQAYERRLLGENILGSGFDFDVHTHQGAGAYICGEETALIESIEGKRGEPRLRPPYPPTHGLWGKPTVVNNVETLASIPPIIRNGAQWFRQFGTEKAPGTKVYTILGNVRNTGFIEVPMGITLREVIDVHAGGIPGEKRFKLAQTGGASGSIIPAHLMDVPMDYVSMREAGASLGSGALLICNEDTCVVDLLRVLMRFFQYENCGKCVPCRVGTVQLYQTICRIANGKGEESNIALMEGLARAMITSSICGLGQAAPVPVLSAIEHFREEIEAHIVDKVCPAGVCPINVERET